MKRLLLVAIAIAGASHVAGAQGIPALGAAKRAANNAVNATNANISEQTGQALPKPRGSTVNTGTAPAASNTATAPTNNAARGAQPASGAASDSAKTGAKPGAAQDASFSREVYTYDAAGRRDPFLSLLASGDLRPSFTDLKLVAVAYDPTGRKSVAVMRDISTKDQYRVKVGQTLGRMRVAQIHPKSVTFTIDEFGYSRQEILALGDSTTRNP
jgi:hypothetical protein